MLLNDRAASGSEQISSSEQTKVTDAADFSLVIGGPFYSLQQRFLDGGNERGFLFRRVIMAVLITWVPLLILTLAGRSAVSDRLGIPFLSDLAVHVRFLVTIPILIMVENYVNDRIDGGVKKFIRLDIITGDDVPRFRAALEWAHRVLGSVFLDAGLLVLAYTAGLYFWRSQMAFTIPTWQASPDGNSLNLLAAGYWFVFVSIPFGQFIVFRWYARFLIWGCVLLKISSLDLKLIATHPDHAGGLRFLNKTCYAFGAVLFAQGALLSGFIANDVLYNGRTLMSFRVTAASFIAFFVAVILSPLLVFTPHLIRTKRRGLTEYGAFAMGYVRDFDDKWIKGKNPESEKAIGSGDIQSLADLGNSYASLRDMQYFPFAYKDIVRLAVIAAAPLLPLALLTFSIEDIFDQLVHKLF